MKTFEVIEDHLKLLKRTYFRYNDYTEFGAPEVDPKRPYGNSSVYLDIGEILGVEPEEVDSWNDKAFSSKQEQYFLKLHKEMTTVLNILVRNNGVQVGVYVASDYGDNWRFKSDRDVTWA